jgi:hypothetical protein
MVRTLTSVAAVLVLLCSLSDAAVAQRRGFIIGGGVGPGVRFGDLETKFGATTDFKIGAMIGQSVQLYYRNSANLTGSGSGYDLEASGVGGLGATYQMPTGFRINGLVGLASVLEFSGGSDIYSSTGFGAGVGVGYEFAKYWVINLDGNWGVIDGENMFNVALTVNILSY